MFENYNNDIKVQGVVKILVGLIMIPLFLITSFIGFFIRIIGIFGLVLGGIAKIVAIYAVGEEKIKLWNDRVCKLISFGTMEFLGGEILSIPFLLGIMIILEGIYNLITADNTNGIKSIFKLIGRVSGEFVRDLSKKQS
jgi:hypothetical protein